MGDIIVIEFRFDGISLNPELFNEFCGSFLWLDADPADDTDAADGDNGPDILINWDNFAGNEERVCASICI